MSAFLVYLIAIVLFLVSDDVARRDRGLAGMIRVVATVLFLVGAWNLWGEIKGGAE